MFPRHKLTYNLENTSGCRLAQKKTDMTFSQAKQLKNLKKKKNAFGIWCSV